MPASVGARDEPSSGRREQILAIAARLMARQGYAATTVREIADEAGILSGSLYHHFTSKEAILLEVLRGFTSTLVAEVELLAQETSSPLERLDRLVAVVLDTIERQPAAVGLYQQESAYLATVSGFEFLSEDTERIEAVWIATIEEAQESGDFRADLDAAFTFRFIRDAAWSTARWFRPDGRHTTKTLTDHLLSLLHAGILTPAE